ncbi:MAG: glycerate kinase [Fimbriimonadales bacterium]
MPPQALRILVAPTAFKGTLSARQAAEAMASGIHLARPEVEITVLPVADGGDGFLECLSPGATVHWRDVTGPLGEQIPAPFALHGDGTAIIESALCCGITLLTPDALDPMRATSRGVGELLHQARAAGAARALVGLGGSATNDGGAGALQGLGFRLLNDSGAELEPGGGPLQRLARVLPPQRADWPEIFCACDVENPLLGPNGCTAVYGPQKGVRTQVQRAALEAGLSRLASLTTFPPDTPKAGAAGGLAFGLAAFAGAKLVAGSRLVLDRLRFDERLAECDVLVTGEGKLDGQTLQGKIVGEVLGRANRAGVRSYAVCGLLGSGWEPLRDLLAADPLETRQAHDAAEAVSKLAASLAECW